MQHNTTVNNASEQKLNSNAARRLRILSNVFAPSLEQKYRFKSVNLTFVSSCRFFFSLFFLIDFSCIAAIGVNAVIIYQHTNKSAQFGFPICAESLF